MLTAYVDLFPPDAPKPTHEDLRPLWEADQPYALVATDDDTTIVGSVVVRPGGELARLHVHPDHWHEGIGRALHDAAERATALWVIDRNERARRFYERNGWVLDPTERNGNEVRYRRYDR